MGDNLSKKLDSGAKKRFEKTGYLVIKNFYDYETEIKPIQVGISEIIEQISTMKSIPIPSNEHQSCMTASMMDLVRIDRKLGASVYDAAKQIPEFLKLVSNLKNKQLFMDIFFNSKPGIAAGGYGVRMDFPNEDKFRTFWHQEFPAQLRSSRGLVFWTPLLPVTKKMGPVQICPGSHARGYLDVVNDTTDGKSGAYSLRLKDEQKIVSQYDPVSPLTEPGDLILMDYYLLHQSGKNISTVPRWSIQFRYFDFNNEFGRKTDWEGSFAAGVDFQEVLKQVKI